MRVLVVEDELLNVELFTEVLTGDGHDVVVARNGTDGRTTALAERFDVILLDLHLPSVDGVTICRDLRAASVRTPILAISASAMPDEIARAMPAGFDAYLTKPISPARLRGAIRQYGGAASTVRE